MAKEKSLKKNVIYNVFYQVLVLVFPLLTSPYIARTLGATQIGQYSYVNTIVNYFVLFIMLGLNNYGNRSIAQVRDDKEKLDKTFSEIYTLQIATTIIVAAVYVLFIASVKEYKILYIIQLLHIISAGLDINWACYGTENFKISLERNVVVRIITLSLIFFLVKKNGLITYTIIMCSVYVISAVLLWPFMLKIVSYHRPSVKGVIQHVRSNLVLFVPVIAVSLYKYMDKIMLGILCDKSEVGYYSYADQITSIPESFVLAIGTVLMPRMSNILAKGNCKENEKLLNTSFEISMLAACAFAFGLAGVGYNFSLLFYGSAFSKCGIFIQMLSPVIMIVTWSSTFRTQYIIPRGKDYMYIVTVSVGALVNLVVNFILIPKYQGAGAIISTLLAEVVVCLVQYAFLRNDLNYFNYVKSSIPFLIIGEIMLLAVTQIQGTMKSMFMELIVQVGIGAMLYIILSFIYYWLIKKDMTIVNLFLNILHIKPIER